MATRTVFKIILLMMAVDVLFLTKPSLGSGSRPVILKNREGMITNPSYPKDDFGVEASWVISPPEDLRELRVLFVIEFLNITDDFDCSWSYLKVQDDAPNGTTLATFCNEPGYQTQPVESSGNVMYVTFHSHSHYAEQGARFSARYKAVFTSTDLDLESTSEAIISTPNYPGNYPSNAYHEWNVIASTTYEFGISIDFWNFDVVSGGECEEDFVEVYEGNSFLTLSRVGKYCNNEAPGSFLSLKSRVRVVFSSMKKSSRGTGFEVKFKRKSLLVLIMVPLLCCVLLLIAAIIATMCYIKRRNVRRRMALRLPSLSLSGENLVQNDELGMIHDEASAQVDSDSRTIQSQHAQS